MPFSARVGFFKLIEAIADFPVWPIVPTQEQMNTELQTNFVSSANATLTYSDFGIIGSGGAKRRHGVAHPNGNIYILPRNNSQMLIYDTSSNVMTTKTLFTDYQGGALSGYNGNIYMMPHESSSKQTVLEFDPTNENNREITGLANIPAANSCDVQSAITFGNSVMFFSFQSGTDARLYNPESNTMISVNLAPTTSAGFISGVYHPDGNVYVAGYNEGNMIRYVPTDPVGSGPGASERFNVPGISMPSGGSKYQSGCLGADNKIYYTPWGRSDVAVYDPVANVGSQQTWGLTLSNKNFVGGALGDDGNIYCYPAPYDSSDTTQVMVICTDTNNPAYNTAVLTNFGITLASGQGSWGGTAGANGKILSSDETASKLLLLDTSGSGNVNALYSPYLNKGG